MLLFVQDYYFFGEVFVAFAVVCTLGKLVIVQKNVHGQGEALILTNLSDFDGLFGSEKFLLEILYVCFMHFFFFYYFFLQVN